MSLQSQKVSHPLELELKAVVSAESQSQVLCQAVNTLYCEPPLQPPHSLNAVLQLVVLFWKVLEVRPSW